MSDKCQAIVRSGKQCNRDALKLHQYCMQHLEIKAFEHLKLKDVSNAESDLISDLEKIVMEYLTPYQCYKLIGINKNYTLENYKIHQGKYEIQTVEELISEYNTELGELKQKLKDVEDKKSSSLKDESYSFNSTITPARKAKIDLARVHIKFMGLINKYRELVYRKLQDANMFVVITEQENAYKLYGIELDNSFTLPYQTQRLKKYYIDKVHDKFKISRDRETYKYVKNLSPLWKLLCHFLGGYVNLKYALEIKQPL